MPSFSDSVFLFVLALLLFGPKKLPGLARELGKWIGEFRRASNEFKMQMDEELRLSEQEERQKKIAAMEAASPVAAPGADHGIKSGAEAALLQAEATTPVHEGTPVLDGVMSPAATHDVEPIASAMPIAAAMPIASAGELKIMPPATGLPAAQVRPAKFESGLGGLLDAIPMVEPNGRTATAEAAEAAAAPVQERATHGD